MAKMFQGKDNRAEEMAEAKALKSGKISKAQYVAGEKSEGHGKGAAKKADAIKSGKMSAEKYAAEHSKKMADGGKANRDIMSPTDGWAAHGSRIFKKMADGGYVCGHRSKQDYGKK